MESSSPSVPFPLLQAPVESTYRACTIPYRFPSDNPRKATPVEIQWIDLFLNSVPSFKQRAENDPTVPDAPAKAEKFAQRYTSMLEELKKNPESHGGPPDCILLCRLRELVLRELGFRDIFKKVKDEENAKAMSLFEGVIKRNDEIEDDGKRIENLVRGILAGNIFDLGSAQKFLLKMACHFWQVARILYLDHGLLMTLMLLRVNGPRNHGKRQLFLLITLVLILSWVYYHLRGSCSDVAQR
uniref:Damage-control phosphatase ARMT1-like metal-binding domain-containing protein n=1 Tax=Zea mays TaxID=4577 RepID=A0A804R263_MAIZE